MQKYNDVDNDSNIDEFEIGKDYISVRFFGSDVYTYTYNTAGSSHVEEMKRLASCHNGLNVYINHNKPKFS